jgi:hypothetical protein
MPTMTQVIEIQVRATATTTSGGKKGIWNIFHYRLSAGSMDSKQQIAGDFESKVFGFFTPLLASNYATTFILVRVVDDPEDQLNGIATAIVGAKAGDPLPTFTTVVTPLSCAQRGRSFRGSKHFAPIVDADQIGDELAPAAVAPWQAASSKLSVPLTSVNGTYQPIVLSRTRSQLKTAPTLIVGSDVVSAALNKTLGTMRKRKEKTAR